MNDERGMTLIELLVGMLILGIVLLRLFPDFVR
jgi:prepilin-type N-terminal cleavage/methylation domain-containing protein